jgi:hypothetical protein
MVTCEVLLYCQLYRLISDVIMSSYHILQRQSITIACRNAITSFIGDVQIIVMETLEVH